MAGPSWRRSAVACERELLLGPDEGQPAATSLIGAPLSERSNATALICSFVDDRKSVRIGLPASGAPFAL